MNLVEGFPGGSVVKNPPANIRDTSNLEDCCDLNLKIVELLVGKSQSIHSWFLITAQ